MIRKTVFICCMLPCWRIRDIFAMWQAVGEAEAARVENLTELASSIKDYEKELRQRFSGFGRLPGGGCADDRCGQLRCFGGQRGYDDDARRKALEFPVVFLPGLKTVFFQGCRPSLSTGGDGGRTPAVLCGD